MRFKMRFRPGQRVRMTSRALEQGLGGHAKRTYGQVRGTVVSYRGGLSITVRRDGLKVPNSYHVAFWEPVRP